LKKFREVCPAFEDYLSVHFVRLSQLPVPLARLNRFGLRDEIACSKSFVKKFFEVFLGMKNPAHFPMSRALVPPERIRRGNLSACFYSDAFPRFS
jgi:hypothetical protein